MKNKQWKIILLVIFVPIIVAFPAFLLAKEEGQKVKIIPDVTLVIPQKSDIKVRWVAPPQDNEDILKGAYLRRTMFSVDPKGQPWIGFNGKQIINPIMQFIANLSHPYQTFVHLESGALFFSTSTELGFMVATDNPSVDEKGIPIVPFQPIALLPLPDSQMYRGEGESLYFAGFNIVSNKYEVYLLKPEGIKPHIRGYRKILESEEKITAVTGNDDVAYIAIGRLIVKVSKKDSSVSRYYLHPAWDITELAYSQEAGLFYVTKEGVGFLSGKGALEFLKTPSPKIFLQKKTLYVHFPANLGIVAIENISDLKDYYDLSVKGVATGSAKVSYIGFFKKTGAGRKPVTQFDIDNKLNGCDIVCEVKIENVDLMQSHRHTVTATLYYGDMKVSKDYVIDIDFTPGVESYVLEFYPFCLDRGYFYPGTYTVKIYIDNVKAGKKNFKITGKPDPFKAIHWNDNETLHRMLKNGLNPNLKEDSVRGRALLHKAVDFGSFDDVRLLLDYGADPNVINKNGNTPLFYIGAPYIKGAFKKAQLLIKRGASVHVKNADGKTPLLAVIEESSFSNVFNPDIIMLLLDAGAEVDVLDKDGRTILTSLVSGLNSRNPSKSRLEVIDLLLSKGANPNKKDKDGYTPLGRHLMWGNLEPQYLRIFLKYGVDVNEKKYDEKGKATSLLYRALLDYLAHAKSDRPNAHKAMDFVRLLIENNARLLPGEEEIIFEGDIYKWIGLDFVTSALNQNKSLFEKAKSIDDSEIRSLVVHSLLALTKNKIRDASSVDDFKAALKTCMQARTISQRNYTRLSIDIFLDRSSQTGEPLVGFKYDPWYWFDIDTRMPLDVGVYIVKVIPDTPASSAGLQAGDIIINFAGEEIKSGIHLMQIISRLKANNVYNMTVLRDEIREFSDIFLYCGLLEYSLGKREAEIDLSIYLEQKPDSPDAYKVRELLKDLRKIK